MARLRQKGPGATRLVRDDDLAPMPIMPWGTVHNLSPTEASAARNTTAISADCGVVSIIAIGGAAHFKQGNSNVVATVNDPYCPKASGTSSPCSKAVSGAMCRSSRPSAPARSLRRSSSGSKT